MTEQTESGEAETASHHGKEGPLLESVLTLVAMISGVSMVLAGLAAIVIPYGMLFLSMTKTWLEILVASLAMQGILRLRHRGPAVLLWAAGIAVLAALVAFIMDTWSWTWLGPDEQFRGSALVLLRARNVATILAMSSVLCLLVAQTRDFPQRWVSWSSRAISAVVPLLAVALVTVVAFDVSVDSTSVLVSQAMGAAVLVGTVCLMVAWWRAETAASNQEAEAAGDHVAHCTAPNSS